MTPHFWLRAGLVAGCLLLAVGESSAQRGGFGGSAESRWAMFAGNADSIDLNDPKNERMRGMLARKYQIPPDGIFRKSAYVEQVNRMSGGPPGGMMGGPGGPGGFPTAPGAPPGPTSTPDGKIVVVSPGSEQTAPPSPGSPGGYPGSSRDRGDRGDRGDKDRGSGDPRRDGGDPKQGGDPIEDPRPVVYRYGSQPKDAPSYFNDLDKDHDGQISLYEWRTGGKQVDDFVALDLNNDGFLTVDENQRAIQLAAEEKDGGKKLDPRSSGRGTSGTTPGGGSPWGSRSSFGGRGGPPQTGGEPPREERSSKGGRTKGDR